MNTMYNHVHYNRLLVSIAIIGFVLYFLILGININKIDSMDLFRGGTTASLISFLFHLGFRKWMWKWWSKIPVLGALIVIVPNLHGTWAGKLHSQWIDPKTNAVPGPSNITVFISQTFDSIRVEIRTDKMISHSYLAGFKSDYDSDTHELVYCYTSQAYAETIASNPWHDGTTKLQISNGLQLNMKGVYWTSRNTIGTIEMSRKSVEILK